MRSDDELLSHIRQQVGVRRQRRQRVIAGAATAAVVLLLGAGALAASAGDPDESVKADDGGTTTTEPATTSTTEAPQGRDTTTSTTSTTTSTTTTAPGETEPPPTTTEAPTTTTTQPSLPSEVAVGDGITVEATLVSLEDDGRVTLSVRIRADHGSRSGGAVTGGVAGTAYYGFFAEVGPVECDELMDDDPSTDTTPDPQAGPVDQTFTVITGVDLAADETPLSVRGITSFCTADQADVTVTLVVPRP